MRGSVSWQYIGTEADERRLGAPVGSFFAVMDGSKRFLTPEQMVQALQFEMDKAKVACGLKDYVVSEP